MNNIHCVEYVAGGVRRRRHVDLTKILVIDEIGEPLTHRAGFAVIFQLQDSPVVFESPADPYHRRILQEAHAKLFKAWHARQSQSTETRE